MFGWETYDRRSLARNVYPKILKPWFHTYIYVSYNRKRHQKLKHSKQESIKEVWLASLSQPPKWVKSATQSFELDICVLFLFLLIDHPRNSNGSEMTLMWPCFAVKSNSSIIGIQLQTFSSSHACSPPPTVMRTTTSLTDDSVCDLRVDSVNLWSLCRRDEYVARLMSMAIKIGWRCLICKIRHHLIEMLGTIKMLWCWHHTYTSLDLDCSTKRLWWWITNKTLLSGWSNVS